MFTSLDEDVDNQEKITFGDNSKGKVKGLGKVTISNDNSITNVLYVQSLSFNLLSVGQLCDLGFECLFKKKEVIVTKEDDNEVIFKGFWHNNLYVVDFSSNEVNVKTCLFTKTSLGWLWHRRLALLTPFLGTCLGWQNKVAVRCLQGKLPMRMVADEGKVERD